MKSEIELSQFLRIFLPTLAFVLLCFEQSLQKCFRTFVYSLNFIGCHCNRNVIFLKEVLKILFGSHKGEEAFNFTDIFMTLVSTLTFILCLLPMSFGW